MHPLLRTASVSIVALVSALSARVAVADITFGEMDAEGVAAGKRAELLLMMWDPVAKVSYTKDLGINVYADSLSSGDPTKNLFVYGQQDTGYQKLFDPLNTDANFLQFLSKSANPANQLWAVIASAVKSETAPFEVGSVDWFTTLRHDTATGVSNPNYETLTKFPNQDLNVMITNTVREAFININSNVGGKGFNTHLTLTDGSSFASEGEPLYLAGEFLSMASGLGSLPALTNSPAIYNKVGRSSWFYYATISGEIGENPVLVDEFDNLGHDAYWGLAVDTNGKYILSYTMEASMTQAQTAAGSLLRLRTDFIASYGGARLISVPGDSLDLSLASSVTAVPEPATWGLTGLGLALVAARARRRS
ncbi:hypothetical protein DBR42_09515 [Pelomonas sp. HMWF004]|nr:hypothetical protein DBR42_09515 [Pelomonas sp. HMWF004]